MATVYRKTSKGVTEITTRAHHLAPRLRAALILVDGSRSDAELGKLIQQQPAETLQELAANGFIEAAGPADEPPRVSRPAPLDRVSDRAATGRADDVGTFANFRATAVRAFNELSGPAGESLAIKMERAQSREQLAPLLETAYRIIANAHGSEKANQFKARFASF